MAYEKMEDLQRQVRELNAKLSDENENFSSLCTLCEALMNKLNEQETITNKYGAFFAEIYRDCCPTVEGEKNVACHDKAQVVYDTIDNFEQIFEQTAEAKAQELNLGIKDLEKEFNKKQGELDAISREVERKRNELLELEKNIRDIETNISNREKRQQEVEENICYRMREEQSIPTHASSAGSSAKGDNRRKMNDPHPQPRQSPPSNDAAEPNQESGANSYMGYIVPESPAKDHIYLCDANVFMDITGLHDIRRQQLQKMNRTKYAQTGRPQFRLIQEGKGWKIGEMQGMTNTFSGRQLLGEKTISNHDIVVIVDLAGQKHSFMFVIG